MCYVNIKGPTANHIKDLAKFAYDEERWGTFTDVKEH